MDGATRREQIIKELNQSKISITGSELSKKFGVSRQVIVSDVALLRAQGNEIISTADGYMTYKIKLNTFKRVFCVLHPNEGIEDELLIVVDNGGHLIDTIVTHVIYGEIVVNMHISSRRQVQDFMRRTRENEFVPLMALTQGAHYHTVEADSEEILDLIQGELEAKGYLYNE